MQQYAGIYLLQSHSTCFGRHITHHQEYYKLSPTSGIGHDTGTATSFHRGLIRPRWKEVAVPVSWFIPEVADTVFSTPDDGCCDARNM